MTDRVLPAKRSEMMANVRSKDTKPEMVVRRLVHSMGYRYKLHVADMRGKPDLVFTGKKKVIFVHGCFWHQHERCPKASLPKTRADFWKDKLGCNVTRDKTTMQALRRDGWQILVVWECQTKNIEVLSRRILKFLS